MYDPSGERRPGSFKINRSCLSDRTVRPFSLFFRETRMSKVDARATAGYVRVRVPGLRRTRANAEQRTRVSRAILYRYFALRSNISVHRIFHNLSHVRCASSRTRWTSVTAAHARYRSRSRVRMIFRTIRACDFPSSKRLRVPADARIRSPTGIPNRSGATRQLCCRHAQQRGGKRRTSTVRRKDCSRAP